MNIPLLLTLIRAFWSEERYHIAVERLYQPSGETVGIKPTYFTGRIIKR